MMGMSTLERRFRLLHALLADSCGSRFYFRSRPFAVVDERRLSGTQSETMANSIRKSKNPTPNPKPKKKTPIYTGTSSSVGTEPVRLCKIVVIVIKECKVSSDASTESYGGASSVPLAETGEHQINPRQHAGGMGNDDYHPGHCRQTFPSTPRDIRRILIRLPQGTAFGSRPRNIGTGEVRINYRRLYCHFVCR